MSAPFREPIYSALFARVKATPGVKSAQRRYIPIDKVSAADCPVVCQVQGRQVGAWKGPQLPVVWALDATLLVYTHAQATGPDLPAVAQLNDILDALEQQLAGPLMARESTLGGLVFHCRIMGDIEVAEAIDTPIALAIVPVQLTATASA